MEQFYETFLAGNATSSIGAYHQSIGDTDIKVTSWDRKLESDEIQRQIIYNHPLHVPMGPPHGQAEKTQTLYRFGNHGICVLTRTVTKDVPMTDCFYIEDCLLVSSNAKGGVLVSSMFDLVFVKSTMFKKIITMTSTNDLSKFHSGFIEFIRDTVNINTNPVVDLVSEDPRNKFPQAAIGHTNVVNSGDEASPIVIRESIASDQLNEYKTKLTTVKNHFINKYVAARKKLSSIDPFIAIVLLAIVSNQFLILYQMKKMQNKLDLLESLIGRAQRNDVCN